MVIKKLLALAILLVAVACPLGAKLNLPSKNLGKESYYYYKVEKNNQSLADIATKIGVTKEDIIKYNPTAKNGVVKNQLLFFPVN
ncbi:MAG: LysM peptidoglycan-binding domain-containing protein, partial [Muribaculaceae bacterium]|nr:LysM peptidoglycan-binding domain-containing protein [Muribaculaceae bacterium]